MECIQKTEIDLAILDVMLPDIDGFRICQKIRENYYFPVIMLTAKIDDGDKIMGLTIGADDYITKPFNPLEVIMGFLRPGQAIISDCGAKAKVAFVEKYKLGKVVGKRKINYGSYYVAEFNLARLAQLDPEGTERYLLENGLDQKEFKAN